MGYNVYDIYVICMYTFSFLDFTPHTFLVMTSEVMWTEVTIEER